VLRRSRLVSRTKRVFGERSDKIEQANISTDFRPALVEGLVTVVN
jgi:hypothetical protein